MDPDKNWWCPSKCPCSEWTRPIIANPNCSNDTNGGGAQALHDKYRIRRVVVSTYQSVTGTGVKAVEQLMNERKRAWGAGPMV